jgi:hypothetical protein
MGYWLVLGLGLAELGFSTERLSDALRLGFEREGPLVERQMFAGEVTPTLVSSPIGADSSFWEAPWLPPPLLSSDSGGTRGAPRRTFNLLLSGEPVDEKDEGDGLPSPSKGELFRCRDLAIQPGPASRCPLSPWDKVVVVVDTTQLAWEADISGISFLTELEKWLEPLGMPTETSASFGICLDMLGFEEYEGTHLSPIEGRHGTPGIRNLSTGLGITFKF